MATFNVDSSHDSRYQAANSLSGSRLNTSLQDVAAVVDVFTSQLIDDFGVTDLDRIQDFAVNIEADSSSITTFGNASSTGRNFRNRGLTASLARNYFPYNYTVDTYNLERLDESRGPNAILYGFGSPGGIVNISTKRAQTRKNFTSLKLVVANTMARRIAFDTNLALVKDRLALRLNALTQTRDGWMDYTKDDRNGVTTAVTFTPFKKTALYFEYEHFKQQVSAPRNTTFWTQTDTWDAVGRPLIRTALSGTNNAAANPDLTTDGVIDPAKTSTLTYLGNSQTSNNAWVYTANTGVVANWARMSTTNRASYTDDSGNVWTAFRDFRNANLDVDGILNVNLMGPSNVRNLKYDLGFVTWQQEILKNLNFEAAGTWQYAKWNAVRYGNVTVYGDPNYYLPEGSASSRGPASVNPVKNPYAGMTYVESVPQFWYSNSRMKNFRATLSYEVDLGKNLGRHRIAGLVERQEFELLTLAYEELMRVNGAPPSPNPTNSNNDLNRRRYVEDPTNPRDYVLPDVFAIPVPLDITTSDGAHVTSELALRYGANNPDYKKTVDTQMVVIQSTWLSGRLNTIVGLRNDRATYHDWGLYTANGDGAFARDPANYNVTVYPGRTYTYSAVAHLTSWLSAFFNASTSIGEPNFKVLYLPDAHIMAPMSGVGHDYGIKFTIPGTRLMGMVTYYTAQSTNSSATFIGNDLTSLQNNSNNMLNALVTAGILMQPETTPYYPNGSGDTLDARSKGLEAALGGDITKNWSIRASYAYTKRNVSNVMPRVNAWFNDTIIPFWATLERPNPNDPQQRPILDSVLYSGAPIRQLTDTITRLVTYNTLASTQVQGTRPHKVRIFSTYYFDHGWLKGARLGGAIRYDSRNLAGQDTNGHNLYGLSNTNIDLMASYTTRFMGARWTFQLNIYNVFNPNPRASPAAYNLAGNWDTLLVYPPREISFTTRVDF